MWSLEKACYVVVAHPLVTEMAPVLFRRSLWAVVRAIVRANSLAQQLSCGLCSQFVWLNPKPFCEWNHSFCARRFVRMIASGGAELQRFTLRRACIDAALMQITIGYGHDDVSGLSVYWPWWYQVLRSVILQCALPWPISINWTYLAELSFM